MPNPKVGTVVSAEQVAATVRELKRGRIDFRVERAGIVHTPVGRRSMGAQKLTENVLALFAELVRLRPASAKGNYVRSVGLSSTMGVGVRIDINDLTRVAD
jgi:large subunit ribosomal protein L1